MIRRTQTNTYSELPFGETLNSTGTTANPFTYSGQFGVTGEPGVLPPGSSPLYLMTNRAYSSGLGRFTSPDPSGFGGGDTNLYRYVGNSPVAGGDPSGLHIVKKTMIDDQPGDPGQGLAQAG